MGATWLVVIMVICNVFFIMIWFKMMANNFVYGCIYTGYMTWLWLMMGVFGFVVIGCLSLYLQLEDMGVAWLVF
jgi:hypothetical protein